VRGYELVLGTKKWPPADRLGAESVELKPHLPAGVALACGLLAIVLAASRFRHHAIAAASAGVGGIAALIALRGSVARTVAGAHGIIRVGYRPAYWTALVMLGLGALLALLGEYLPRAKVPFDREREEPPARRRGAG
jgi:hypothetical protein